MMTTGGDGVAVPVTLRVFEQTLVAKSISAKGGTVNSMRLVSLGAACLGMLVIPAAHANLGGVEVGHGSSRAQACKMASDMASMAVSAARAREGRGQNSTRTRVTIGGCDCEQDKYSWTCSVTWGLEVDQT